MFIGGVHEITQELVNELLRHGTGFHVGFHVYVGHLETQVFQHGLHGDDVRMNLAPRHGFHRHIDDVGTVLTDFENGSHGKSGTAMPVVLYQHIGVLLLNGSDKLSQHTRTSDARHILQADFRCPGFNQPVGNTGIVFHRMDGRIRDAERSLRYHARFQSIFDRRNYIPRLVQSAEDTGNVHTLGMLHLVHQPAHICRNGIHAQCIQPAVEHMRLYACFPKRCGKGAYSLVGIFTIQKVYLLKSSSVCFNACKTTHFNYQRSNTYQLVYPGLILTGRLPHVPVNKTEFNFLFHHSQ